jgi:hypothetical protein
MERWFNRVCTAVMAVCAVISAYYGYLAYVATAPSVASPAQSISGLPSSPPWWVAGIGLLAIALLITRWGPPIFRGVSRRLLKTPQSAFESFQTRRALDKKYPTLGDRLKGVSTVWAIRAVGARFVDSPAQKGAVKRLILPNPETDAAKFYFRSIDQEHARALIKPTTLKAIRSRIEVRWCNHFLFHSITIADPAGQNGWAYVEHALPHCTTEERPGYTIHRRSHGDAMDMLVDMFEKTWQEAEQISEARLQGAESEANFRVELRKFVLSHLDELLSRFLQVMSSLRDKCEPLAPNL